ncbi:MAG: branched-chain amino acid ABC transporter permease [Dehalococcoidales bacterium]|nr:branched-chain amino acid ABC transporter permease [Dehalococcoidales bacterium]
MDFFLLLLVNGLVVGSIYALVALGFVLIYKSSDVLNLAQGELVMLGAYICFAFVVQYNIPFFAAFVLTLVFSTILGLSVERVVLRPLIGQPIISVIMVTIGLSSVLRALVQAFWGTDTRPFPTIVSEAPVMLGSIPISQVYIYSLAVSLVLLAIFTAFFRYSKTGIAMRAVADDQQAALSMGISVRRIFAMAWIIAAVVSAIGGIMVGLINGINISLSYMGLKVLPVAILGGLDSIPGAVIGGLTIGVLENLSGGYIDPIVGGGVKEVAPFVFLVFILMIKPYGLFGKEIIERV